MKMTQYLQDKNKIKAWYSPITGHLLAVAGSAEVVGKSSGEPQLEIHSIHITLNRSVDILPLFHL